MAHDEAELAALKAAAAERLSAGQAVLDLGVAGPPGSEPLPITSSKMTHLWDGLCAAYQVALGPVGAARGLPVAVNRVEQRADRRLGK